MLPRYSRCRSAGESGWAIETNLEKEDVTMKWGGFNREGEKKMRKLFGGKALYVLLTIAAAGLLMGEMLKWRPG
jgi:hypothetical protein